MQKIVGIYSTKIGKLNTEQSCQLVLVWAGVQFVLQSFQQNSFSQQGICSRCIEIN